jgi:hypothetical protein
MGERIPLRGNRRDHRPAAKGAGHRPRLELDWLACARRRRQVPRRLPRFADQRVPARQIVGVHQVVGRQARQRGTAFLSDDTAHQ